MSWFPSGRWLEGFGTSIDLNQAVEALKTLSPSLISSLGLGLMKKRHDIAGFFYGIFYTTNFNPRIAGDHYLFLMLIMNKGDLSKCMTLRELCKNLCEGGIEVRTGLNYLKHKGLIEMDGNQKSPIFMMTEKGAKQARKVTLRFQEPGHALSYRLPLIERIAGRVNMAMGRKNIL